jgi:transcriptional regulator of acetoin/glycerol metabolism
VRSHHHPGVTFTLNQNTGNARQLRHAVQRAAALAPESGDLLAEDFAESESLPEKASLNEELVDIERARILNALHASNGNTAAAARILNVSRTTLTGRIKRLGIEKPRET